MKSKVLNWIVFAVSLAGIIFAVFFIDGPKAFTGALAGVFGGMAGLSCSGLFTAYYYKKHPSQMKIAQIEEIDERNVRIRDKAKSRSSDIIQWFIIGIAYINIAIDGALWFTLIITGVFLLRTILYFWFIGKYQKEM